MAMKRIFLVLALLLGLCVRAAAPLDTEKIWNDANTAYVNADYPAATEGYERLLGEGYESAQLYLNLGNAYFKRGMNGRAILNYRKALRLAPGDEDIRYNLSIAEARTQDRIESVPVFFVKRWIVSLGRSVGSNTWAVLSLVFFALMLFCTGVYLLLRRILRSARLAVAFRRFGRVRVGRAQGPPASRRGGRHELGRAGQKLARRLEHRYFRAA